MRGSLKIRKVWNKPQVSEATRRSFAISGVLLRTRMSARRPLPSDALKKQVSQEVHPFNGDRLGQLIGAGEILLE